MKPNSSSSSRFLLAVFLIAGILSSTMTAANSRQIESQVHELTHSESGLDGMATKGSIGALKRMSPFKPPAPTGNRHPDPPFIHPTQERIDTLKRVSPFTPPAPTGNRHPDPPFIHPKKESIGTLKRVSPFAPPTPTANRHPDPPFVHP